MVAGRLQEKSGYFYVVLSYKNNNGVRKQPWFRTGLKIRGNKKNAEKILLYYRMNFNIQSGRLNSIKYDNPAKQMNMLFGDYLLLWLEEIKITVAETTYAGYRYNVKNTIAPYFNAKGIRLSTLSAYALNEFYQEQRKRVSANTVIRYHANIYKALSDAMKDGLIADNPAKKVHKPKAKQYIAEYYTKDELKALFKAVKGTKIEFAVLMAGFYGLRREEIVGLKWSAVHFEEKTITIKHTIVECNVDGIRALADKPIIYIGNGNEILSELKRQGNNLNQVVKNNYFGRVTQDELLSAIKECKSLYKKLSDMLGGG